MFAHPQFYCVGSRLILHFIEKSARYLPVLARRDEITFQTGEFAEFEACRRVHIGKAFGRRQPHHVAKAGCSFNRHRRRRLQTAVGGGQQSGALGRRITRVRHSFRL